MESKISNTRVCDAFHYRAVKPVMATSRYGYFPLWLLPVMPTFRCGYFPLWLLPVMPTFRYGDFPLWLIPYRLRLILELYCDLDSASILKMFCSKHIGIVLSVCSECKSVERVTLPNRLSSCRRDCPPGAAARDPRLRGTSNGSRRRRRRGRLPAGEMRRKGNEAQTAVRAALQRYGRRANVHRRVYDIQRQLSQTMPRAIIPAAKVVEYNRIYR